MIRTSEQVNEIAAAMAKAQLEIENVEASGTNPAFKRGNKESRYAKLGDVLAEVRPKFAKHGIAIWQAPVNGDGANIGIVTRFGHSSGQWIESTIFVAPTKFDAQGAGSVISYLRRYALMAMAGVAPEEDDDGNAAVGRPDARPQTNGATRTASAPPPPAPRAVNAAAIPATAEETPEITAARQRVRMLIEKYDRLIVTAPNAHALDLTMEDGKGELAEIEAAGVAGKEARAALRKKYEIKMARFEDEIAA